MDACRRGWLERLTGTVDVLVQRAGQAAHRTVSDRPGNRPDGLEVTGAGNRETRLDNIDVHALQCLGNTDLLIAGHGRAGALFPVTQSGVKDNQLVCHVLLPGLLPASTSTPRLTVSGGLM